MYFHEIQDREVKTDMIIRNANILTCYYGAGAELNYSWQYWVHTSNQEHERTAHP
jgi:hypothetical protein